MTSQSESDGALENAWESPENGRDRAVVERITSATMLLLYAAVACHIAPWFFKAEREIITAGQLFLVACASMLSIALAGMWQKSRTDARRLRAHGDRRAEQGPN